MPSMRTIRLNFSDPTYQILCGLAEAYQLPLSEVVSKAIRIGTANLERALQAEANKKIPLQEGLMDNREAITGGLEAIRQARKNT